MNDALKEAVKRVAVNALIDHHHANHHIFSDVGPADHEGTFFHQSISDFGVELVQVHVVMVAHVSETNVGPHAT